MDEGLRERYKKLHSGLLYDALKFDLKVNERFVLPRDLVPQWNFKENVFGQVFTARGRKTSDPKTEFIKDVLENIREGSVYLLQANDNSRAHFGDITALFMTLAKVEGAIIQGWTRDVERIERLGFKLWAKGTQPQNSIDRWDIYDYDCEIVMGNIFIRPEDYIFADRDGILVIRSDWLKPALRLAEERYNNERTMQEMIIEGFSPYEIEDQVGIW